LQLVHAARRLVIEAQLGVTQLQVVQRKSRRA
jgi:hypothetical protein